MESRSTRSVTEPAPGDDQLAGITTRAELGTLLTQLRARSGLSLRELATRVNSSASTLSGWCRAENLPFPSQQEVFRSLLAELGVEETQPWIEALIRVRDGTPARGRDGSPPYRGLESFTEEDAGSFFGRSDLIDHALGIARDLCTRSDRSRVLVLVGASGSGKSSLARAGLRPRLAAEGRLCRSFTPGATPLERLAETLDASLPGPDTLADDPSAWLAATASIDLDRLVLVIDQLEELFTVCEDAAERDRFLGVLETLADPTTGGCLVVATLRIDLYGELVATGRLAEPLETSQVLVGPMDTEQLVEVIVEPARQAGWSVDDDLVSVLLRDFLPSGSLSGRHPPGALPMLSYALLETWQRSRRGRMTVADYHAAGGIAGAIEQAAETVYGDLPPAQQALARDILLRLVRLSDDAALATRRAASLDELQGLAQLDDTDHPSRDGPVPAELAAEVAHVLDRFVEARLLTMHETTIELTHEALLDAWPRLATWIEHGRDSLRVRRTIAEATRLWLDSDRDPSTLAGGVRLAAMRSLSGATGSSLLLSQVEREFIARSVAASDAAAAADRRRTRRLRALVAATSALAVLAGGLALAAGAARSDAIAARDEALSRQVALTADRLRETDPTLASRLATVGHAIAPTSEARSTLLDTAIAPRPARYLGGAGTTVVAIAHDQGSAAVSDAAGSAVQLFHASEGGLVRAERIDLADPEAEVYALSLAPDGRVLAIGDTTASIDLWDIGDPDAPRHLAGPLHGPGGPIQGIAFDPSGSQLAAVGLGDGVFRWDVTDPTDPDELPLLPSAHITWSVDYRPDGTGLAVGNDVGEVVLWDLTDEPAIAATLEAGERAIVSVAFAPAGDVLAAGSQDSELRAWDAADPASPTAVEVTDAAFGSWVNTVSFTPDGAYLAAGSSDTDVRIWDTSSWLPVRTLPHPAAVTDIAFPGAGGSVLTAATDGTARSWELATVLPPTVAGAVWGIAADDSGERLLAFAGGEAAVWTVDPADATPSIRHRLPSPPDGPSFSGGGALRADGMVLALGTVSGEVLLAELDEAGAPTLLEPALEAATGLIEELAFTPDGTLLAAGGRDTEIHLWDVADPRDARLLASLDAPTQIVLSVAFSPSAPLLAATSADNHVYLFDVGDVRAPRLLARLDGFDSDVYTTTFSPDGAILAAAGSDAMVRLWDVTEPTRPRAIGAPITGPTGRIFSLSFAPDGEGLAAAVVDGTTWVWDLTDPQQPERASTLQPHAGQAFSVRFEPTGRFLLGAGASGQLWVWPTDERSAIERNCSDAGDAITEEEWNRYLPDRPYDPPCR